MRNSYLSFCISIVCLCAAACSSNKQKENRIMVTIEPQRYFAEQLAQPFFTIEAIVPNGTGPETYDPTPNQMASLAHCKAYWAIGDLGFENALLKKIKDNFPDLHFVNTNLNIDPIISCVSHGNHKHENADPHIWTSPKEVGIMVQNMYEALIAINPENKDTYTGNLQKLRNQIAIVDKEIREHLANSSQKAFIIYHPALSYFARDYNLIQYSIEEDGKEPSPELLKNIINTARKENIRTIFIQQEFDKKNAETIAKETGSRLVVINPLSYNWSEEMIKIAKALSDE